MKRKPLPVKPPEEIIEPVNEQEELGFVNFCISFHQRMGLIIEKWRNAKTLEMLPEEEEAILRVLHKACFRGELAFGNEQRDPGEIKAVIVP